MASGTDISNCIRCGSDKLEKVVWQSPYVVGSRDTNKVLRKWGLNCIRDYTCNNCGVTWRD